MPLKFTTESEDAALSAAKEKLNGMLAGIGKSERRALLELLLAITE